MKSSGTALRFSEDQLRLSEGIRSLIILYNSINSVKMRNTSMNYSIVKECIVKLLAELYGGSCTFNDSNQMFIINYSRKIGEGNPGTTLIRNIEFRDQKQLKLFLMHMRNLVEMIETSKFVHFLLAGTEDYIKTDLTTTEEWEKGKSEDIHNSPAEEIFYGPYRGDKRKGISLIDKAVIKTFRKGNRFGRIESDKYRAQVSNQRNYYVVATTDFGNKLLRTISRYDKFKEVYIIPHFQSASVETFHQLAVLCLVHFHLLFDPESSANDLRSAV
jgi:hypothetical protein